MKVAILGANGFIGSRMVELFYLSKFCQVRPIVRQYSSMARLARFSLDACIADGADPVSLQKCFTGCDIVIHCASGNPDFITASARAAYMAAAKANTARMIYLSSASVHGQNPAPGLDERTPLSLKQPLAYNVAKIKAEQTLLQLSQQLKTELVILRPGIVFGPRSRWTAGTATALINRQAFLFNHGRGICNSIYVDNLLEAVSKSCTQPAINREIFLVSDKELVTWADFYGPIARAFGIDMADIPSPAIPDFSPGIRDLAGQLRSSSLVQRVLPIVPGKIKRAIKSGLKSLLENQQSDFIVEDSTAWNPAITLEMSLLQQCAYKLPMTKAEKLLKYCPPVSFEEGCLKSVAWLKYIGYPVQSDSLNDSSKLDIVNS